MTNRWTQRKIIFLTSLILSVSFHSLASTERYDYDGRGNLSSAWHSSGILMEFQHDGIGNRLSLTVTVQPDSDTDGLPDSVEKRSGGCTDMLDADTDDDGIPDGLEDTDGDGIVGEDETSPCIPDSDGDGIQDGTEQGYTSGKVGPDTDPSVFIPDSDPTTQTQPLFVDTDGDGFRDGIEDRNRNGRVDSRESDPGDYRSVPLPGAMPWLHLLIPDG
jgi:hypothetical protein